MNYVKKLNLHWFCTQNHILEPFSVRRACTKSYVTSEPYPRASQIWCQNVRETWKKKVIKCRGESFVRCRVIARNVEGGAGLLGPPSLFRVNPIPRGGGGQFDPPVWNLWLPRDRHRSWHTFSWDFSFKSYASFDTKFAKIGSSVARSRDVLYSHVGTKFAQNPHFAYVCVQNTRGNEWFS